MKKCVTCHIHKAHAEFNRRTAARDGLQDRCRSCSRQWYVDNRVEHAERVRVRNNRVRAEHRLRLLDYLSRHPCVDCGESDVRVLEFDHRPDERKTAELGTLIASCFSWPVVEREIAKCDVRCANCHRRITSARAGWGKHLRQVELEQTLRDRTFARLVALRT